MRGFFPIRLRLGFERQVFLDRAGYGRPWLAHFLLGRVFWLGGGFVVGEGVEGGWVATLLVGWGVTGLRGRSWNRGV
jgi:hypothetical protein